MNRRERRLAAIVVGTIALWLGNQGLQNYQAAVNENLSLQREAVEALADTQVELARGRRARRELNEWRGASLPTNRDLARSLYQDWLRTELLEAGLQITNLSDNSGVATEEDIAELSFVVRAKGNLDTLVAFLSRFYHANHLQRISAASVVVGEDGEQLDVQLTVDALILADATRSDQLPETTTPLNKEELEAAIAAIVPRNIFSPYKPPAKPEESVAEAAEPADNAAERARLTSSTYGGGGWRITLREEDAAPTYYRVGDALEVGQFSGQITEIDRRRIVVETAEGPYEVRLGQKLSDAIALDLGPGDEASEATTASATPDQRDVVRPAADTAETPSEADPTRFDGS